MAYAGQLKGHYVADDYSFLDEPGKRDAFHDMVRQSGMDGHKGDTLFVENISVFAGNSLADFKSALLDLQSIGMKVQSVLGDRYDLDAFITFEEDRERQAQLAGEVIDGFSVGEEVIEE